MLNDSKVQKVQRYKKSLIFFFTCVQLYSPPIDHNYMKEPIKMHVEFSLLYKILLIIEMRSKILKAKGAALLSGFNTQLQTMENCG